MNIIQQIEAEQVQKLVEQRAVPEFSPVTRCAST